MDPKLGTQHWAHSAHNISMPRGFPVHRSAQDRARDEEALREAVIRQIEAQQSQVKAQIALIKRSQIADEAGDALENLEAQLKSLEGQKAMAAIAPIPMLAGIAVSLPAASSKTHSTVSGASVEAVLQSGHLLGEMTHEVYENFSHRLDAAVSRHYASERQATRSATGSFKSAGYGELAQHFNSAISQLERERDEAKKRGDWVTAREKDHLVTMKALDANKAALAIESDPEKREELLRDRQTLQDVAAEKARALKAQYEAEARKRGQEQGLSGNALNTYIQQDVAGRWATHLQAVKDQAAKSEQALTQAQKEKGAINLTNMRSEFEAAERGRNEAAGGKAAFVDPVAAGVEKAGEAAIKSGKKDIRREIASAAQANDPFGDPMAQAAKQYRSTAAATADIKPDNEPTKAGDIQAPATTHTKAAAKSSSGPSFT